MTISEDAIKNSVLRYHRVYDGYLKLSARVGKICRFEIVEGNVIRAQVTFRAKSPKSIEGNLDLNSSDLLLVLLLQKVAPYIVSTSGDAVSDGIARIRWFAARFQELSMVDSGGTG